jgi:uncharacterized membrane protein
MRRDTKIVFAFVTAIPALILGAASLCTWAVAQGASPQWRLLFRVLCHGIAERCLTLWGTPMPICTRCTGIYLGMLAGLLAFLLIPRLRERVMRPIALAAAVPLAIDGLTQLARLRESTNTLRMETGLLAGMAFGLWILSAVEDRSERVIPAP